MLVIEDDLTVSGVMAETLSGEGFQVIETTSAHAGVRIARQHQPSVIVLDLVLPDGSGLDVLDGVKRHPETRAIPIVAVSGAPNLLDDPAALRADAVLPKPFSMDRLVTVVHRFAIPHAAPVDQRVRPLATQSRD